jgi:hypothetical protein
VEEVSDEQESRDPRGMVGEALAVAAFEIGGSALLQRVMERSDRFDPKDPLIVAVLQSETRSEHHLVTLSLKNAGAHGVYVEAVTSTPSSVCTRRICPSVCRSSSGR